MKYAALVLFATSLSLGACAHMPDQSAALSPDLIRKQIAVIDVELSQLREVQPMLSNANPGAAGFSQISVAGHPSVSTAHNPHYRHLVRSRYTRRMADSMIEALERDRTQLHARLAQAEAVQRN